jgi:hypothetical protein
MQLMEKMFTYFANYTWKIASLFKNSSIIHKIAFKADNVICRLLQKKPIQRNKMVQDKLAAHEAWHTGVPSDQGHRRTLLFGKIQKNAKREMLLEIICFQSQVFEFLPRMSHYCATVYIIDSKVMAMSPLLHDSEMGMCFQSAKKW